MFLSFSNCTTQRSRRLLTFILSFSFTRYSNTNGTGALSWTVEADGSFPLKQIVASSNFTAYRSELDSELANKTLTPLQSAQYDLLKTWADAGNIGWLAIRAIPSGGIVSTRESGSSYYTLGMSLYVSRLFTSLAVVCCSRFGFIPSSDHLACVQPWFRRKYTCHGQLLQFISATDVDFNHSSTSTLPFLLPLLLSTPTSWSSSGVRVLERSLSRMSVSLTRLMLFHRP